MRSLLKESDLFESTKPKKIHKERVVFRDFSGSVYVCWFQALLHMNCINLSCEV